VVTVVGVAAVIMVLAEPEPVRAAPTEASSDAGVVVDAVGSATGTPDLLRVTLGVEATAERVEEALQAADAAARRVLDALRAENVPEGDVQTVNVSIYPTYGSDGQAITGYTARHDFEITLRDLPGAGETIGVLVGAGGDAARVQGISYGLEDDAALQEEARAEAFAAAQRKAEQYAALSGRELGDVVEIREQVAPSGPVPYATGDAGGGEVVPLAPGSMTVSVTAQVRWSLA
jgi:uncharacterized protein YggE